MNWMDNLSRTDECVTIGRCKICRLLFEDDLVLLVSSESGLQHAINGFAAPRNIAGMKISTSKTEVLHLSRNPVQCFLQVSGVSLKQMEKFKYLGVAFTSDERQDEELHVQSGKASAVMRALHHSVVLKRELSNKAQLSVFKSIFVPILTYDQKSWVTTKRVRLLMQASKMRCLRKIKGVTMVDKHRNAAICEFLDIESLLLWIERSQLRWIGHVSRMPQEQFPKQTFYAKVSGKRPVKKPRTRCWLYYIKDLGWDSLGLHPSEMQSVLVDGEMWRLNLELLPPQRKAGEKKSRFSIYKTRQPRSFVHNAHVLLASLSRSYRLHHC